MAKAVIFTTRWQVRILCNLMQNSYSVADYEVWVG